MSINVTITLPLPTATAVQQGDFDKAQLSQLVIDAVKALPLLGAPSSFSHPPPPFERDVDGQLTPPALSTYDPDVVTVRDGHTSRATSPPIYTPNPTEYDILPSSSSRAVGSSGEAVRHPDLDFKIEKFPVTVIHEGKGVHPIHVNSGMTGAELAVLIEHKSGVEIQRQRIRCDVGKKEAAIVLGMERTLHASGIRKHRQLHLTALSGICFPDSDLDFWIHVKGCVSERKLPIHTKSSTTTVDVGLALFETFAPFAPFGRREMRFQGRPVFSDGGYQETKTMDQIGVKEGCFLEVEIVVAAD